MILHITNDYSGSTVYKNLINELDKCGIQQIVYHPLREKGRVNKNKIDFSISASKIVYRPILSKYLDRIFYRKKIDKIVADLERTIDLNKISFIHAHTWYSDGGVALKLYQKYKIPYIIAVRNSDINIFFRYLIYQRNFARKILLNSKKIIVISASYMQRMREIYASENLLTTKLKIIPNGVDPYWITNRASNPKKLDAKSIHLLYIGKFDKGKNVLNLMKAILETNKNRKNKLLLTLVGGGGGDHKEVTELVEKNRCFKFFGKIMELEKLKSIFEENHFFVMPSKAETFGLVYIEALLQGLPVLYTKGEGIDGYYDSSIGEKVEDTSVGEIQAKLDILTSGRSNYNFDIDLIARNHNWENIAKVYSEIYKEN